MSSKLKLLIKDCSQEGDRLYFIAKDFNLICSLNMQTFDVETVGIVPESVSIKTDYMGCVTAYNGELYIGSADDRKVWIFNLKYKKWTEINRKKYFHIGSGGMLQSFVYGDYIYMVGSTYPAIMKIHSCTKNVVYIEKPFVEKGTDLKDAYFRAQHMIDGSELLIPCCFDNTVLRFDLNTESYQWEKVGGEKNGYSGICYDGENYYLSPRHNTPIVVWNRKKETKEIKLPSDYCYSRLYFGGCTQIGKEILFWSFETFESLRLLEKGKIVERDFNKYCLVKKIDDCVVLQKESGLMEVYSGEMRLFSEQLEVDMDDVERMYNELGMSLYKKESLCMEGDVFSLANFLEQIG